METKKIQRIFERVSQTRCHSIWLVNWNFPGEVLKLNDHNQSHLVIALSWRTLPSCCPTFFHHHRSDFALGNSRPHVDDHPIPCLHQSLTFSAPVTMTQIPPNSSTCFILFHPMFTYFKSTYPTPHLLSITWPQVLSSYHPQVFLSVSNFLKDESKHSMCFLHYKFTSQLCKPQALTS